MQHIIRMDVDNSMVLYIFKLLGRIEILQYMSILC